MIKTLLKLPFILLLKLVYNKSDFSRLSIKDLFLCSIRQKIFGPNRNVPWPVHNSSKIICQQNIVPGTWPPGYNINCYIDARNGIIFEENVRMGPGVSIISMNHDNLNYSNYLKTEPVKIGKNSWLAANCIILPGVNLGEHTIVAAGAVVTKSYPQGNQLLAGNPARVIKNLAPYKEQQEKENHDN